MTILWRGLMQNPLVGHHSGDGWNDLEAPFPARQAVVQPDGMLRLEVRFGDVDPRYSDQRALLTAASQTTFHEGDEIWMSWSTEYPPDHVLMWPKQDELANWPSSSLGPGSCVEWHHAPSAKGKYHGDWNLMPQQSAPIYTGVNIGGHYLSLTKSITESVPYKLAVVPLVLGLRNRHVQHTIFSADPTKGLIEYWINGVSVGGSQRVFTLFPDCDAYLTAGLYRRVSIGDPSLVWPADARPGGVYTAGFVPRKGQRVYTRDDGYPAHMLLGTVLIGTTQSDVTDAVSPPPTTRPPVPPPPPVTPPPPPAVGISPIKTPVDPARADAWRLQLIALAAPTGLPAVRDRLVTEISANKTLRVEITTDLDAKDAALQDLLSQVNARIAAIGAILDKGQ